MKDQRGFYQGEQCDTLPGPGARKRANGDLGGQEMRSKTDTVARRAVIYIRVASAKDGSLQQVEQQLAACREVATRLGLTVISEYQDVGSTDRPGLSRLFRQLNATRPTCVVTLDLSRFGRRYDDNLAVHARLASAGVGAVFVQGPTDEASVTSATLKGGAR